MELLKKILGPIGFVLILIGGVMYGIFYTSGSWTFLPLLAGLVCTIAAVTISLRGRIHSLPRRDPDLPADILLEIQCKDRHDLEQTFLPGPADIEHPCGSRQGNPFHMLLQGGDGRKEGAG